jgi:acyl CoA:acetate/3-ketoacid CoA transferase
VDLEREVLAQAGFPLRVASDVKAMDERLFREEPMGLRLQPRRRPR